MGIADPIKLNLVVFARNLTSWARHSKMTVRFSMKRRSMRVSMVSFIQILTVEWFFQLSYAACGPLRMFFQYIVYPAKKGALFLQHPVKARRCDGKLLFIHFSPCACTVLISLYKLSNSSLPSVTLDKLFRSGSLSPSEGRRAQLSISAEAGSLKLTLALIGTLTLEKWTFTKNTVISPRINRF